jgi:Spy/CpxP family protein refolding chaperone
LDRAGGVAFAGRGAQASAVLKMRIAHAAHKKPEKRMTSPLAAILVAVALVCAPTAFAADKAGDLTDMEKLRTTVQQDKRGLVASTLNLTDAEGKKFWPIYDTYQRTLNSVDQRRNKAVIDIVGMDRPMSDPYARQLANELIQTDEAEIKARRTMQNKLMRALPPRKAARYLQLESKIRAVEAYEIASSLPLVK